MRWRGNRPGTGVWKTLQTLFNGHGKHFLFHVGYFCIQDICVWIVGLLSWETSPVILIGRILLSHSGITVLKFVIVHFCRALFEDFCGTLLRDSTRRSCAAPLSICLMWQPCLAFRETLWDAVVATMPPNRLQRKRSLTSRGGLISYQTSIRQIR